MPSSRLTAGAKLKDIKAQNRRAPSKFRLSNKILLQHSKESLRWILPRQCALLTPAFDARYGLKIRFIFNSFFDILVHPRKFYTHDRPAKIHPEPATIYLWPATIYVPPRRLDSLLPLMLFYDLVWYQCLFQFDVMLSSAGCLFVCCCRFTKFFSVFKNLLRGKWISDSSHANQQKTAKILRRISHFFPLPLGFFIIALAPITFFTVRFD